MTQLRVTETVLAAIADGQLDQAAVLAATGLRKTQVQMAIQKLRVRRLIEIAAPGHYAVTDAGRDWIVSGKPIVSGQGPKKPRPTSGLRQRAWWLMVRDSILDILYDLLDTTLGAS